MANTTAQFLSLFTVDNAHMLVCVGAPNTGELHPPGELSNLLIPANVDVFFGPAQRKPGSKGDRKADVVGARVGWVDVDNIERPQSTLPPSIVVFSGHGWHMYWLLRDPIMDPSVLESINKTLIDDVPTADKACWNANRVLRVPGTTNTKQTNSPVQTELRLLRPGLVYCLEDFIAVGKLSKADRHKIRTGDSRGFRSRSERDWSILTALVAAGATDELIKTIFDEQPCGDKHRENEHYLPHTLTAVRAKEPTQTAASQEVMEKDDGYYIPVRKGLRRISTFTFEPGVLLDGSAFGAMDALVGAVHADEYEWPDTTFTRAAFTSVARFDKEAPVAAWQFLGSDADVRSLLPYLLDKLKSKGLPRVAATPVLGLHYVGKQWYFLGDKQTLSKDEVWTGYTGPVAWLPTQREHTQLDLIPQVTDEQIATVADLLPQLNEPGTIWPMIGWYTASCLKPWIEAQLYRFPILNVSGTKGSGKTTLITRVFLKMLGSVDPKTFDSGTTRFVSLALLGSANAVPIAFSEFRYGLVEHFLRFVLLAYDTGHDPRGRGDQTTVDYPLSAPFSLDGEDLIEDPAARERVVVAQLHPRTIDEGSDAYAAFQKLRYSMPAGFGGYLIQQVLKREPLLKEMLEQARKAVFDAFPAKLPDRVRNNHVIDYFGIRLWCDIMNVTPPDADVLYSSITSVFDIAAGRARTLADSMIEDIINAVAQGQAYFNVAYDGRENVLWFQLAPAHTWWITSRRRQGRGALERDAIRSQLKEAPYSVPPQVVSGAWMFGIDLVSAAENGLDIPTRIPDTTFVERI